jgi:hypothetical protein
MASQYDDPIGRAVYDYHFSSLNQPVIVHCDDFEDDTIDTSYLFRTYNKMPALEKKAMGLCRGSILDVGACAGAHSVYLQSKGFDVAALELSQLCCSVLKSRGVKTVVEQDILSYNTAKFDTILLLMNGTGIAGTLRELDILFYHLRSLLNEGGQILIDSSDLIFLFEEDDGSTWVDLASEKYYGELVFQTEYKSWISQPFPWLYVDLNTLNKSVEKNQMKITNVFHGKHYDYLAQIQI